MNAAALLLLPCLLACRDLLLPAEQARLALSVDRLDLGSVAPSQTAEQALTLSNAGDPTTLLAALPPGVSLLAPASPDPENSDAVGALSGAVYAAHGDTALTLRYSPPGYAPLAADLILLGPADRLALPLAATTDPDGDDDGALALLAGGDDCDDTDSAAYPGAEDVCGDHLDQDCDGADRSDCDQDGLLPPLDCDDADPALPAADRADPSAAPDQRDNDCDGRTDEGDLSPGDLSLAVLQAAPPAAVQLCSRRPLDTPLQGFTLRADPSGQPGPALTLPALTLPADACLTLCEIDDPGCTRIDLPDLQGATLTLIADAPLVTVF